jgi:hypothetical protein
VRFEPHFFDPAADTYFTYSFAWVLDGASPPNDAQLASQLRRYFAGLMTAVGKEKHAAYDVGVFDARVKSEETGHYQGEVRAVDAFGDGRALLLHLDAEARICGSKTVVLVSLSPHPVADPTFQALLAQRATFACTN